MKGNNQAYKLWLCLLCSFILLPLEIQAQEKGDSITGKVHKICLLYTSPSPRD